MSGRLVNRSTERSIDRLIDWSIDRSIDQLIDWLIDWLIDRLIDWLINRSIDWSTYWLIDWLIDSVIHSFIDWLSEWVIECKPETCSVVCRRCGVRAWPGHARLAVRRLHETKFPVPHDAEASAQQCNVHIFEQSRRHFSPTKFADIFRRPINQNTTSEAR